MTPEQMKNEIWHLELAIRDIAPKVNTAMKTFHTLRNKHTELIMRHRDLQKQLKLELGEVTKLAPSASAYRKPPKQESKVSMATIISNMTKEEKEALKQQLLEGL